jgi:AraC-like DNA-binding protein
MTVLEIACRCGFHNTANFNRAFLRFTGLTPSEYRKDVPLH